MFLAFFSLFPLAAYSEEDPAQGVLAVQDASEGGVMVRCPSCGAEITVGRHAQLAQGMKCPVCGKEICPKEEEKGLCYGADAAFLSKYVARAVTTTDGWVFEPNTWVSYRGFTAGVWANMDLTDRNRNRGEFNEVDLTLDFSASIGRLGVSGGAIYYIYPNTCAEDTGEVYGGLSYDMLLKPRLVVYYDFWQADGFYGVFSFSHSFDLPQPAEWMKPSLDLSGQVGWGSKNFNSFNFGAEHGTFTDIVYTASLPVVLFEKFTVKPMLSYSSVLDRAIRSKNLHNDNIIWGAVFSASMP